MKLYLSSLEVPDAEELLKLLKDKPLSVLIVSDAWDVYPKEKRLQVVEKTQNIFRDLSFSTHTIRLSETPVDVLRRELTKRSLVWVMGGNSFYLNDVAHKSGFAGMIRQLIADGLVYGGESAGAVLATPTLRGVEFMDDPAQAPEMLWEGLARTDFGIIPHWNNEKFKEVLEKSKAEMEKFTEVVTLENTQALIINGEHREIISHGNRR